MSAISKPTSFRTLSTIKEDIDAYLLEDDSWFLFVHAKNKAIEKNWSAYCEHLTETFPHRPLWGIGGALKTKGHSQPLASYPPDLSAEVWTREEDLFFRLETRDVLNPGLFLDQTLNRKTLGTFLKNSQSADLEGLNLFSYTGSFSVWAAKKTAAKVTSVDWSGRYLEWEGKNHERNATVEHSKRIRDDARLFLRRCFKKNRKYHFILIDPPTFSRSDHRVFQVEKELQELAEHASLCLYPGGVIFLSTHCGSWVEKDFYREWGIWAGNKKLQMQRGTIPQGFGPNYPLKSVFLSF
jgi:23S rRNA G2069 N7-methylase RlmK/C1962 C5-methylase RlmI